MFTFPEPFKVSPSSSSVESVSYSFYLSDFSLTLAEPFKLFFSVSVSVPFYFDCSSGFWTVADPFVEAFFSSFSVCFWSFLLVFGLST